MSWKLLPRRGLTHVLDYLESQEHRLKFTVTGEELPPGQACSPGRTHIPAPHAASARTAARCSEGVRSEVGAGAEGSTLRSRSCQTCSVKSRSVNIFVFVGHMVSVTTPQLCPCTRRKAASDTT